MHSKAIEDSGSSARPTQTRVAKMPLWFWDIVAYAPAAVALPTLAGAAAVLWTDRPRALGKYRRFIAVAAGTGAVLALARWQLQRLTNEGPRYVVERRVGALEIRRYAPVVLAETHVNLDFDAALNEGFRRLANYIFGENQRAQKIAMTSPVMAQSSEGEKIAMTSPVLSSRSEAGYTVAFVMPKQSALASLPTPADVRVTLRAVPERRIAVLRYSGRYGAETTQEHQARAVEQAQRAGLRVISPVAFAGYDPPSTLPILRRNEAWLELETV